jgi:hypothetical protein
MAAIVVAAVLVAIGAAPRALAAPAAPNETLTLAFAPGSPAPPVLNQSYAYAIDTANVGDVPLDNMVIVDTVPVQMSISSVTTGSYTGLAGFAAGEGVRVSYEKNTAPGVFTLWGSSPSTTTSTTLTAPPPGLGAGEYITRVRWQYAQAAPGMRATVRPVLAGRVTNPSNSGGPVVVGDAIQNCAAVTAVYVAGPTNVSRNVCQNFNVIAGPAIDVSTSAHSVPLGSDIKVTATLTGGAPTGFIGFRAYAASDAACSTPKFAFVMQVNGAGSYTSTPLGFRAGAYKWVASYLGDAVHAAASTGCDDPAGAFVVVAPPTVAASFGAATINVGGSTPLTFTITNPAVNTVPLTGVALEDTLPAGLAVASPNGVSGSCGSGTITATPGSQRVSLTGGSIPVGASCSFSVDVIGTAPGPVTNTTDPVGSANGGSGDTASAALMIHEAPSISGPLSSTFITGQAGSVTFTTTAHPMAALSDGGARLPHGVSFVDNGDGTATLSGTPAVGSGGTYRFTVTAGNGVSPDATHDFTLTVDQAPAISSASSATFLTGHATGFTVTSTGFPAPGLSIGKAALPNGMRFQDNGDGTATLSGTPAAASGGTYRFTVTAANGVLPDATQSFTLTVSAPPSVSISSPSDGARYERGQRVPAGYACEAGAGSPGLSACSGPVADGEPIGTATAGGHSFSVTAISRDGQRTTRTVHYTVVLPDNRFTVKHVRTWPSGRLRFQLTAPGPGIVDVLETARRPNGAHASRLLQPGRGRLAFARKRLSLSSATTSMVTVHPSQRGRQLVAHHQRGVTIRLWVSYTPANGRQRNIGIYPVHISGRRQPAFTG